ncbi:hypothetical protein N0V93_003113 [Gnomoniopsis smithogilvyi]|uniref:Domain of unknown function at the cortex 1 domain-containing protein n=1 Tax=Gnomoniopsis smithogilvyi TaxID=1191159 RepID=A0A9W9CZK5_9PEZI|nr:hypothetical protein N0V93_003113 [Gnomoniopsis smithogilvyi]
MADKYVLRVTAGPTYDLADHTEVPVNTATPVKISSSLMDIELNVKIQNYRGLPRNSPTTSPYFDLEPHASNKDQYSIAFRFTPKHPSGEKSKANEDEDAQPEGISASDLQFGNDFDHPIRDRLPPGFSYAMKIVKWWIDPGLDGDPYADSPYLFGPALSSFNAIHVGEPPFDEDKGGIYVEEGGSKEWREDVGAPNDGKARMKWALSESAKEDWLWEYGRPYGVDFFNAYIDFSEFALKLPGYAVPIMKYWDGQGLRYVLRNKTTKQVYLVVLFTLYLKEDVNEDGTLKPEAQRSHTTHSPAASHVEDAAVIANEEDAKELDFDGEAALKAARKHLSEVDLSQQKDSATTEDDVD